MEDNFQFGLLFATLGASAAEGPQNRSIDTTDNDELLHRHLSNLASAAGGEVFLVSGAKGEFSGSKVQDLNTYNCWSGNLPPKETIEIVAYHFAALAAFTVFVRNVLGSIKDGIDIREKLISKKPVVKIGDSLIPYEGQDIIQLVEEYQKRVGVEDGANRPL